jgi:hypothetical protein
MCLWRSISKYDSPLDVRHIKKKRTTFSSFKCSPYKILSWLYTNSDTFVLLFPPHWLLDQGGPTAGHWIDLLAAHEHSYKNQFFTLGNYNTPDNFCTSECPL